ncbi:MAG: CoA transferase [Burkholderiales bacterium]|nr:CoA transferase [Burkholderiales bacterium]
MQPVSPKRLPLDGITVLALEQVIAAPFATRQLAELGARVIKIERPDGGDSARGYDTTVKGLSSHFVWTNRGKESIALNVKRPDAMEVVHKLLARADVFVQNLAPGAADRLGLGGAALRARYPRLIVCAISGYGSSGPYRDKKAYDLLVQCEAGMLSITGTPETPSKAGIPVADISGGMYAFAGILAALYRRERTGEGAAFEASLFDGLSEWMGYPLHFAQYGGAAPQRTGAKHAAIAPYGPFATGDGKTVFLGIQNERDWLRFCAEVLERPALAVDARFANGPARVANRDALEAVIAEVFARYTHDEAIARLEAADIANASMTGIAELIAHPQHAARQRWHEADSPAGPIDVLAPPLDFAEFVPRIGAIPALGEHTESILGELGYSAAEIRALRSAGAI